MKNLNILKDELTKIWDANRAVAFLETVKETLDEDQIAALSKMIGYVEEEYKDLSEDSLAEIMMGMDTFDGPLEFLEYFFKMTQEDIAESVIATLKEDPEEVEAMLESMEDNGILEFLIEMDAFYVWYKG